MRRAFTIAAKKYHPDRVGGADAPFKRVQAAWEVLREEGRRKEYDASLTVGRRPRFVGRRPRSVGRRARSAGR